MKHSLRSEKSFSSICILFTVIYLLTTVSKAADQNLIISDFKDASLRCDYLIVSPDSFAQQSLRLAEYHYDHPTPDVKTPRVVTLSTIYKQFKISDTIRTFNAIYDALHWAKNNWAQSFTYVVLMGDDSVGTQKGNPIEWNRGPMPSFAQRDTGYFFGDDTIIDAIYRWTDYYYTTAFDSSEYEEKSLFMIARIPCENIAQCSVYIDKVVTFDTLKKQLWNNRAIFLADDDFQGIDRDPLHHMPSCEMTSDRFFKGYFGSKIYSAFYQLDHQMNHSLARDDYFSSVNKNGALWTIYFGHGHHSLLADERLLLGTDAFRFKNINKNGAFLSLSCENGAYHLPLKESMCKQFLFAPQTGYLVYIASIDLQYADVSDQISQSFFTTYDTLKEKPLGFQWWLSLQNKNISEVKNSYTFMGDPALYFSKNNSRIKITQKQDPQGILQCSFDNESLVKTGSYHAEVSIINTAFPLELVKNINDSVLSYQMATVVDYITGVFNGNFDVTLKSQYPGKKIKVALYAWNDTADARGELIIDNTTPVRFIAQKGIDSKQVLLSGNNLYVNSSHFNKNGFKLTIYSADGRAVYSKAITSNVSKISLGNLSIGPGMYIVNVKSSASSLNTKWIKR